jgi:hypothetical protein
VVEGVYEQDNGANNCLDLGIHLRVPLLKATWRIEVYRESSVVFGLNCVLALGGCIFGKLCNSTNRCSGKVGIAVQKLDGRNGINEEPSRSMTQHVNLFVALATPLADVAAQLQKVRV